MTDPDPLPPLSDAFLDRIVDGGLTPAELREALDRLGREPDGWKRCALAFLEAQCWTESFRSMDGASTAASRRVAPATGAMAPRWSRSAAGRRLAVAAGIAAVSFVVGWQIRPDRMPRRGSEASLPVVTGSPALVPDVARTGDMPASLERPPEPVPEASPSSAPAPRIITVGRIRVSPSEGAPAVPIVGGSGIDEQWVTSQPPTITEHQLALLEQQGYQVDRRRRLVTATLRDGRRVTVPVDRFLVRYTGSEPL
jgi:hypothetical protein